MKRFWSIFLGIMVWVCIFAYILTSARFCERKEREQLVRGVEVVVRDSADIKIITPDMVRLWLSREGYNFQNTPTSKVNIRDIEHLVRSRGFVRDAEVYTSLDGVIHISLRQRMPIARVNTLNGYNFYITDDNYILPLQSHHVLYVPVITGSFVPPFDREYVGSLISDSVSMKKKYPKNYEFITNLINFVRLVDSDRFWSSQIVQINVTGVGSQGDDVRWYEPDVEVIPRAGDHIIMLGDIRSPEGKFEKLRVFYDKVLRYEGWGSGQFIDLRYGDLIVCRSLAEH